MYEARSVPPEKRDHTAVKQTKCAGNFMEKLKKSAILDTKMGQDGVKLSGEVLNLRFCIKGGRGNRPRADGMRR